MRDTEKSVKNSGIAVRRAVLFLIFISVCLASDTYAQPDQAPVITSTPPPVAYINQLYQYDVEATGFPPPSFVLGNYSPEGMVIDSASGLIEWTPSRLGRYFVTVGATNGIAPADSQDFFVDVITIAPLIISNPKTTAFFGEIYTYEVQAAGEPAPRFDLAVFPEGMAIDSLSGTITWRPAALGRYDVTVVASNEFPPADSQHFSIQVTGMAPEIVSMPDTTGLVDHVYRYDVEAIGAPPPFFALAVKPEGMTIDPVTGMIEWTPSEPGAFVVIVLVVNGVAPVASQPFTINVALNVAVDEEGRIPDKLDVGPNYPNPFSTFTTIEFGMPAAGPVEIVMFDMLGRQVEILLKETKPAGWHRLVWNNRAMLPRGMYLLRVKTGQGETRILRLIKL